MFSKVLAVFDRPHADPAAKNFPLLGSPWPVIFLILGYLLIVLKYGKKFMDHRQPFEIKKIIIFYNFFQVIYNGITFGSLFYYVVIRRAYPFDCLHTLPLDDPKKNIERMLTFVYFINKIIDLLDTVFFVLRKSYKQITFLHVYHHSAMVCAIYWTVRFYGFGGQFAIVGLANTFVHTVMYFYYMISAIYTGLKGSLWWKKSCCQELSSSGSPWPVTFLILGYLLIVLKYGKKFMDHRQPFEIKKIIIFYNFFQVIYNGITFGSLFYYVVIRRAYPFDCLHTLPLDDPKKNIERMLTFVYFINKIIDLLDTIFFVLRKSYKQITFLHVYHHSAMRTHIIIGMISKVLAVFDRPHADPAAKNFPLLGSAWPVTLILSTYLFFVLKCGKKFMEHRQPYDIRKVMIVYNLFQVIYNATLFGVMFYYYFISPVYPLDCLNTLPFDDPNKNIERIMSYVYFINKIIDLLDTIFIVLRKSYKQITFLHVFHHTLMVFAIYWRKTYEHDQKGASNLDKPQVSVVRISTHSASHRIAYTPCGTSYKCVCSLGASAL
ncbi:hypothetical protein ACLKA6_005414 [Drosophila palustris]